MILERKNLKNSKSGKDTSAKRKILKSKNQINDNHEQDNSEKGQIGEQQSEKGHCWNGKSKK